MMIQELELEFTGIGQEIAGFTFKQKVKSEFGYIYKVSDEGTLHYEVFERIVNPRYDFANKCDMEGEFLVSYPRANAFGFWAWTTRDYNRAIQILKDIEARAKYKIENPKAPPNQGETHHPTTPGGASKKVWEAGPE